MTIFIAKPMVGFYKFDFKSRENAIQMIDWITVFIGCHTVEDYWNKL